MITVTFKRDRETKNTVRFVEEVSDGDAAPAVGTLYVQKPTIAKLGNPERVQIVLSTAQ